jgi:hypothetical protein
MFLHPEMRIMELPGLDNWRLVTGAGSPEMKENNRKLQVAKH